MDFESSARLAGFALAHAAWSICDATHGELLTPLLIVDDAGAREMMRFESAIQDAAIEEGKRAVTRLSSRVDMWAFAREGLLRLRGSDVAQDVLVVEFAWRGQEERYAVIQPYEHASGRELFRLAGDPIITRGGEVMDAAASEALWNVLNEGARAHPGVTDLWDGWRR
jgi:hypothetical protein